MKNAFTDQTKRLSGTGHLALFKNSLCVSRPKFTKFQQNPLSPLSSRSNEPVKSPVHSCYDNKNTSKGGEKFSLVYLLSKEKGSHFLSFSFSEPLPKYEKKETSCSLAFNKTTNRASGTRYPRVR